MPFDSLVTNAGRLRILTALAAEPAQAFVQLRRQTGLTDGNLSTHARRLQSAGFVAIEKSIASGKPLTTLRLTARGRDALTAHAHSLAAALGATAVQEAVVAHDDVVDDWVD
jgi:DNA-binding MarR family transcriptional regulator